MNKDKIYTHYDEINKSINSCTNIYQLDSCERMINTFGNLYKDEKYDNLLVHLWDNFTIKRIKLNNI